MLTILLNSEESKFKICGMILIKTETLTDVRNKNLNGHKNTTKFIPKDARRNYQLFRDDDSAVYCQSILIL
jgi:hypothetical protein